MRQRPESIRRRTGETIGDPAVVKVVVELTVISVSGQRIIWR